MAVCSYGRVSDLDGSPVTADDVSAAQIRHGSDLKTRTDNFEKHLPKERFVNTQYVDMLRRFLPWSRKQRTSFVQTAIEG